MKRILSSVFFLLILSSFLFAAAPVKLTIWTGFPETETTLKKAAELYSAKNPNVSIDVLTFDFSDLQNKALVAIPAGSAADLVIQEMTDMYGFAKAGLLNRAPASLEKWIKDGGHYVATAAPILGFNGAIYAVPFQSGGPALFYNEDYLKEAGLNGPPRTVVELYDYAKKLRKTNAAGELIRAGLSIRLTGPGGGTQKFSFIAYQFSGKQVLTPGKKPGTFYATADAPGQAEALMWFVGLLNGNDKADDWGLKHDSEGFAAGDAAMLMRESWVVPYLKENAPDLHYGVSLQPKGKYWGVYDYFAGFTVPEAGKNKAAAWDFARSTQEKVVMEMLLKESGWIPPRRDLDYGTVFAAEPHYKAFIQQPKDLPTYFEASCAASHEIWVSVGEIIQAAYRDASLVNNLAGCQAVMKKANDKANEILKRMNEYGE